MITAIDVAWAAGFIEGEGTFASVCGGGVSLVVPHGMPAAAATMTVFGLLSPRRKEQALALLNKWKAAPGHRNLQKTHCPKGHEYTAENIYRTKKNPEWRICRACTISAVRLRHRSRRVAVIANT